MRVRFITFAVRGARLICSRAYLRAVAPGCTTAVSRVNPCSIMDAPVSAGGSSPLRLSGNATDFAHHLFFNVECSLLGPPGTHSLFEGRVPPLPPIPCVAPSLASTRFLRQNTHDGSARGPHMVEVYSLQYRFTVGLLCSYKIDHVDPYNQLVSVRGAARPYGGCRLSPWTGVHGGGFPLLLAHWPWGSSGVAGVNWRCWLAVGGVCARVLHGAA